MLASYSRHPLTVRLPVEKKQHHSGRSDSYHYKSLPKLKTTSEPRVMQPHERLPGVSQLLTPRSPPPIYPRGQGHRHQSHHSADSVRRPTPNQTQHRSSLPLEDILCPPEYPSSSSSSSSSRPRLTTPPYTNSTPTYSSAFFSPGSQYSIPLARGSPPRAQLPSARSDSFTSYSSAIQHNHSSSSSSEYYYNQTPKPSSRGSGETSLTSSSSGSSSIPPPTQARLIGEQLFPGEGLCWVYSDGSHVRKEIDGEAVNPQWGVTKAGKPRKRLAQACLTCREKKIKCDLADPKCIQCDKSGRECRYASARASRRLER